MRTQLPSALFVIALACSLFAAPVHAQSIRTFVSVAGSDSNPCSLAQPCRHFQAAVAATAAGGEVDALDPGAYGSFTISQAITIQGQGWAYVAPPANGAAITINAGASDKIAIHDVTLNGVGVAGAAGIAFNSGAELQVVGCVVRNFLNSGIAFTPTVSSNLVVSNTFVADNAGFAGVYVSPHAANLTVEAVLNRVELHSNFRGLYVNDFGSTGGTIDLSAVDTVASNNFNGFEVNTSTVNSPVTHVALVRVAAVGNSIGVIAAGPQSTIRLAQSLVTGNGSGWGVQNGSLLLSYGNNFIDGNANNESAPSSIGQK